MDDVAHSLGAAELGERTGQPRNAARCLHGSAVDEQAPELAEKERRPSVSVWTDVASTATASSSRASVDRRINSAASPSLRPRASAG